MAEAFGVEQGSQTTGFSANPNNQSVARPQGITGVDRAGANIAKGISDFIAKDDESNIIRSITSARDKMRRMEASGKTPVEISTFRDEAVSTILDRFPSAQALNLVNQGLRSSRSVKTEVRPDGTKVGVNSDGEVLGIIPDSSPDEALQTNAMSMAVMVEADMPTYSSVGTTIARKANDNGVDASRAFMGATTAASLALGSIDQEAQRTQAMIPSLSGAEAQKFANRSKNRIMGHVTAGLIELQDQSMHDILGNNRSNITPGDIRLLADSYVNDMVAKFNAEGLFGLYDIEPAQFRRDLKEIAVDLQAQADAAFNHDTDLLQRLSTQGELRKTIADNQIFQDFRETHPEAYRLGTISENLKDVAVVMDMTTMLEATYASRRPESQSTARDLLSAIWGQNASAEMIASRLPDIRISDARSVESVMSSINFLMDNPLPGSKAQLLRYFKSADWDSMRAVMEDAGRVDELDRFRKDFGTAVGRMEEIEKEQGVTFEQLMQNLAPIRDAATGGQTRGIWGAIGGIDEAILPQKQENPVSVQEQEAAKKVIRDQLGTEAE